MALKKREGQHYDVKKRKNDDYYHLKDLVGDITGIDACSGDSLFDSNYKALQRLVKVMQKSSDSDMGPIKIHKDFKESFVEVSKQLL